MAALFETDTSPRLALHSIDPPISADSRTNRRQASAAEAAVVVASACVNGSKMYYACRRNPNARSLTLNGDVDALVVAWRTVQRTTTSFPA
jgi:hypothetical protein